MFLNDNKYKLIQCKNYDKGYIGIESLAGFNAMMLAYEHLEGIVYYTSKLTSNYLSLKPNKRVELIKKTFTETNNLKSKKIIKHTDYVLIPRDYQLEAVEKLKGKTRTILQLPCGMGKTLVSMILSKEFKKVIVLSNLKAHSEQNQIRFNDYLKSYADLLVESNDGTRDKEEIKQFINDNEKAMIFSTYKSLDVLIDILVNIPDNEINNYYVVIDEFHNISYTDVYENIESPMYKLLHSKLKILFMSATPRLFGKLDVSRNTNNLESEVTNEEANEIDVETDPSIFGSIDYKYEMAKAIENKYITDYNIYVPSLVKKATEDIDKIYTEMKLKDFNKEISVKARFILKGCLEKGSKKCIIYCKSHQEANEMNKIIASMANDYFAVSNCVDTILSVDNAKQRKDKMKQFIDCNGYAFICSVDILNECIDIPECDSIFITYTSQSHIRNIQRLCRANRLNRKNPYKVASIFLWIDANYFEMEIFIKHIKEFTRND